MGPNVMSKTALPFVGPCHRAPRCVKLPGNEKGVRMMAQMRRWALAPLVVMLAGASPSQRPVPAPIDRPGTPAADSVDRLARDVQRVESLRAVKDLQRAYAQY